MKKDTLVIAVSSRALFDMDESNDIFIEKGINDYLKHHSKNENKPLKPGTAFPLVKKLISLNNLSANSPFVEVIVVSNVHPDVGLRIIKSIDHYELDIKKSAFTGSSDVVPYLSAFGVDLLLSKSIEDTQRAVDAGIPAASLYSTPKSISELEKENQIRIAFDGDAVIFSDESEAIYKEKGLEAFLEFEEKMAKNPMTEGPFTKFLQTIQKIQNLSNAEVKPFRLALVTARGSKARERVLRTLRAWEIDIDETFFLSGMEKSEVLKAFRPHIFFDDQDVHLKPASQHVPSAKVPYRSDGDMALLALK